MYVKKLNLILNDKNIIAERRNIKYKNNTPKKYRSNI